MIVEVKLLIGAIFGFLFILGLAITDGDADVVSPFFYAYILIITMITFVFSLFYPLSIHLKGTPALALFGDFWIGYAIMWGSFLTVFAIAIGLNELKIKLSDRHLWKLQRTIHGLEHQIKERQERKELLKQLEGAA